MARVTIIIEDEPDRVKTLIQFEPPLDATVEPTAAVLLADAIYQQLQDTVENLLGGSDAT